MPEAKRLECPSQDRLEQLVAGELQDEELGKHIQECSTCRERVARIQRDNELLREYAGDGTELEIDASALPTVEGYEIISTIHHGGQGIVYKAIQTKTKRKVALKTLLAGALASRRQRHRFEREIEVIASLRHPNIVTLYDSGVTADGSCYFAMEYIRGVRLDEYLRRSSEGSRRAGSRDSRRSLLGLFTRICAAVQYAHQRGIIHRDLKPGNILVDSDGEPHVLDFGVAKALGQEPAAGIMATQTGEFMGTVAYAAPEQVKGDPDQVDTRSDVYSLGVILFEMLTGNLPYPVSGTLSDVIRNITEMKPVRPSTHRPGIGDEVDTIVLKALSKERERRYQSADALRQDIERYLVGDPIDAKRDSTWYVLRTTMRRYKRVAGVAAAFVVLLTAFAIAMTVLAERVTRQRDEARRAIRERMIAQARAELGAGNTPLAEDLLWEVHLGSPEAAEAGVRGGRLDCYWALWKLYSRQPCLATWFAHQGGVDSVSFSPTRELLASGGRDGTVKLWQTPAGRLRRSISVDADCSASVSFSPDGSLLAWGTTNGNAVLWSVNDDVLLHQFEAHRGPVNSVAFSRDGKTMISAAKSDKEILLWDVETRERAGRVVSHVPLGHACLNPDGTCLAYSFQGSGVSLVDLRRPGTPTILYDGIRKRSHWSGGPVQFSPDGAKLAAGIAAKVKAWDVRTQQEQTLYEHKAHVISIRFGPDNRWLASAGRDAVIRLYDRKLGRVSHAYTGHDASVGSVAFNADGQILAAGDSSGLIKLWEIEPGRYLRKLSGHESTVHCVRYSSDGRFLVSSGDEKEPIVRVWDASTGELVHELAGHTSVIAGVAFHPDGSRLASADYDRTIRIWDLHSEKCLHSTPDAHGGQINMLAYSPDGRLLATCSNDQKVKLWDGRTLDHRYTFHEHSEQEPSARLEAYRIPYVCFSPDGRLLASCDRAGSIFVWNVATRTVELELQGYPAGVRALAFSPDGRNLASGSVNGVIELWDVKSGRRLASWDTPNDIFCLGFHPQGRILASAGIGNDITLWDATATGDKYLATLVGHDNMVFSVDFHPDGTILASGSQDATVGLWDLTYYDRHIAGNLEYRLQRLPAHERDTETAERLKAWAAVVLDRPWPRKLWMDSGSE